MRGSAASPVVFQPDTARGVTSWHGIRVGNGGRAIFDTVTIRDAYCGIEFENTSVCTVNAPLIEDCEIYGIYSASDNLTITGSTIRNIPNGYGVRSVNANLDMTGDTIYRCDYGVSQEGVFWGGTVECCQFGKDDDTNGTRGLYIEGNLLVKQCEFDGYYSDPTILVDADARPTIYSCYLDGDMATGTGIYADVRSAAKVRSTRVRRYADYGIHCFKAGGTKLGNASTTDGNNSISQDTTTAKVIWAELCSVTAENNYYYTVLPKSGLFKGSVDWDPYLTAFPDSIPDSDCDGIDPPDSHHNKIVIVDQIPSRLELGQNFPNPFNP